MEFESFLPSWWKKDIEEAKATPGKEGEALRAKAARAMAAFGGVGKANGG